MFELKTYLKEKLGSDRLDISPCGGGCTAQSYSVQTDHERIFVKTLGSANDVFQKEANGLNALAESKVLNLPEVIFADDFVLCLKWIDHQHTVRQAYHDFGIQLAKHHRYQGSSPGFYENNYIGRTKQINTPIDQWNEFFVVNRLEFQYSELEKNGLSTALIEKTKQQILDSARVALLVNEPVCSPLHGDLWGGNHLMNRDGDVVLIDPAFYFGHREADLALMKMFGSYPQTVFDAYEKEWPLLPGSEKRLWVYQLYHAINHVNLEGHGYLSLIEGLIHKLSAN